jgi:hypothetical protein
MAKQGSLDLAFLLVSSCNINHEILHIDIYSRSSRLQRAQTQYIPSIRSKDIPHGVLTQINTRDAARQVYTQCTSVWFSRITS